VAEPAPGENVVLRTTLDLNHTPAFHCVWTDQNVYWSRIDAPSGAVTLERIPLTSVEKVVVVRVRPFAVWLLAPILVLGGAVLCIFTLAIPMYVAAHEATTVSALPLGLVAVGVVLPFVARDRFEVRLMAGNLGGRRWRMPLVLGSAARTRVRYIVDEIVDAAAATSIESQTPPGYRRSFPKLGVWETKKSEQPRQ